MRKKFILLFFTLLFIVGSSTGFTKETYCLVCKGGRQMVVKWTRKGNIEYIYIFFQKAPYSATQRQPASGQCAWVDRPLKPDEPNRLGLGGIKIGLCELSIKMNKVIIKKICDENLRYLIDAVNNGKLFYVHCYRVGRTLFIRKIGP